MQNDIKKEHRKKIVIASILKPINDTRMFEKFGLTIAKTNKYSVFLIGFQGKYLSIYRNIHFKPLFNFNRFSLIRIFAPIKFLWYIIKIKPEIIIIQTYELLFAAAVYNYFKGTKLIYDVQENYYKNIKYSKSYNFLVKYFLSNYVRAIEIMFTKCIDHYILAEKCYANELTFIPKNKFTVIENKYLAMDNTNNNAIEKTQLPAIRILFSGTVCRETGVFDALDFIIKLNKLNNHIYMVIAGHYTNKKDFTKIKKIAFKRKYIKILGSSTPMNHQEIINQISKSNFGIIPYPINEITKDRIPTKLYEYMANELPVICTKNPSWMDIIAKYAGGIEVDFKNIDYTLLLKSIENQQFFNTDKSKKELLWLDEEPKLIGCLTNLVNTNSVIVKK